MRRIDRSRMNYLWEAIIRAREQGIDFHKTDIVSAAVFSPYMELSFEEVNKAEMVEGEQVEINPYYRFNSIFKNMFLPDNDDYPELKKELFNILMHSIGANDVRMGMTLEEYYKKFLRKDIEQGVFGNVPAEGIKLFDERDIGYLLNGLLRLYRTGTALKLFQEMAVTLLDDCIVYAKNKNPNEILMYVGMKKTKENVKRVQTVIQLFAGLHYQIEVYYEYHFGILGVDATMKMDGIALC